MRETESSSAREYNRNSLGTLGTPRQRVYRKFSMDKELRAQKIVPNGPVLLGTRRALPQALQISALKRVSCLDCQHHVPPPVDDPGLGHGCRLGVPVSEPPGALTWCRGAIPTILPKVSGSSASYSSLPTTGGTTPALHTLSFAAGRADPQTKGGADR